MKKVYTLLLVHQHPLLLLALKKKKLGAGLYNGYGGRVEEGESVEEAAKRETREECGIEVGNMQKLGINTFHFEGNSDVLEVHIFKAEDFAGEAQETDEMGPPEWFAVSDVPYEKMWEDDRHWLPLFLEDKKFKGEFFLDSNGKVLKHRIDEMVECL